MLKFYDQNIGYHSAAINFINKSMIVRILSYLLSATLLVILSACTTTRPAPVRDSSVGQDQPPTTQIRASELQNQRDNMLRDSSIRILNEFIESSKNMTGNPIDVALESLRLLESVPSGLLSDSIRDQRYDPELTAWLELTLELRTLLINGSSVNAADQHWADNHYGHAINRSNFPELVSRYGALFTVPSQVAILLPTEGSLATAAKAIRDGIVSAYLEQPGESVIRFYSSGQDSASAIAAYLQAKQDGATQIIGPLRIESTRALANLANFDIPILLLNEAASGRLIDTMQTATINSLSMSRTEEATAIANAAINQGQKKAIVIVPDNAWGARIETAFTTIYEKGEGHVSATAHFDTTISDHSAMLTKLLKIDESRQRKTDLQSRLGINLTFEPSRRDDFDFIFMAANPVEGRELKPLLRFHDTGDIPVYAMGRIFSGIVERASDQDLNGIVFPTTRWQLEKRDDAVLKLKSVRNGSLGNLYALGQDAWHLLPWLPLMRKDPDLWFPGFIGALRMQSNGQLFRQAAWAQFSAGRPVSYQWPKSQ